MRFVNKLLLVGVLLASASSFGAVITNSDFATQCSFSGWNKFTDGGDVDGSDFSVSGAAPDCAANIGVGDWDTSYAFANGLSQELNFSSAADSTFMLSIDFSVNSVLTSQDDGFWADILTIALLDGSGDKFDQSGQLGSLFDMDINGFSGQQLELELDNSFANQSGWSLEFLMLDTFDTFGSTLSISNVSLTEISSQIPEPAGTVLLALGLAGLLGQRKLFSQNTRA